MKLKDLRNHFTETLSTIYPKTEIDFFFFLLVEEYLDFQRVDLVLKANLILDKSNIELFSSALRRLKRQEPIQYILGKTEFYGFPFLVNEHTLIPRPETEELVSWIIDVVKSQKSKVKNLKILDIGTGTGCIPVALKKKIPEAQISAIDISIEALKIAKQNAELNKVDIDFFERDVLTMDSLEYDYDIIVSNPPYVRELEKEMMHKNVLDFEPKSALFVEDTDPLVFYKKITELALNHLKHEGLLFFEINEYLEIETKNLIKKIGFPSVEIKKDIFGKDRMVKASM